mmetsp:Transcript_68192/g.149845  ORF Transcript_68192/g.149845 Transcript_68192/m.149845 type:complete len:205 (+) Transcript_68192:434-1048(+)
MAQRVLTRVAETVDVIRIEVNGAIWQLIALFNDNFHFFAVVGKVVVMLHLSAVGSEGFRIAQEGATAAAFDLLRPALLSFFGRFFHVLLCNLQSTTFEAFVTFLLPLLLLIHRNVRTGAADDGVIVLSGVKEIYPGAAQGKIRTVGQHLHGLAAHHSHFHTVVLCQTQNLIFTTPMEFVADPHCVFLHAVEAQEQGPSEGIWVL